MTARSLPGASASAGDDGTAAPVLAAALARAGADPAAVPRALLEARVLVPVVAVLLEEEDGSGEPGAGAPDLPDAPGSSGPSALRREKTAEMAVVTLAGRDGRRALPVFSSLSTLARWRPDARPVPVAGWQAAVAAYDEGAEALLVDVAGPLAATVQGASLRALAERRPWLPAQRDPEVAAAVGSAVEALRREGAPAGELLAEVWLAPGGFDGGPATGGAAAGGADAVVLLALGPGPVDPERLRDLAGRLAERLRVDELLRARLDAGLDLAVVAPGAVVPDGAVRVA